MSPNINLLDQDVDLDTQPVTFLTTIAATTSPATFDPRQTPTGEANDTIFDVAAVIRVRKV
jgi:hypothetical protein